MIKDMPKLQCPFIRENNENREYVVMDELNEGYDWVFNDDSVRAIEKLHGTNVSIVVK